MTMRYINLYYITLHLRLGTSDWASWIGGCVTNNAVFLQLISFDLQKAWIWNFLCKEHFACSKWLSVFTNFSENKKKTIHIGCKLQPQSNSKPVLRTPVLRTPVTDSPDNGLYIFHAYAYTVLVLTWRRW